jgi:hypothetical protein
MAVETGLHRDPKRWHTSEQQVDQQRRISWTAYAIEVTLAYNFGHLPSIGHENITSKLPDEIDNVRLGVFYIRHRQNQGRIMSRMYQVSSKEDVI